MSLQRFTPTTTRVSTRHHTGDGPVNSPRRSHWLTVLGLILSLAWGLPSARGQVTWTPAFATVDDTITIIYNTAEGNRALAGAQVVYGHFGLVTAGPNSSAWALVVGTWATDDARVRMTPLGGGLFSIRFHIRSFFSLPAGTQAFRLGMVFRNLNGSVVGRSTQGTDIFIPLTQPGELGARFSEPAATSVTLTVGESVRLRAASSVAGTLILRVNGTEVVRRTGSDTISYRLMATQAGNSQVTLEAQLPGGINLTDRRQVVVRGPVPIAPVPAGKMDGINYDSPTQITLVLAAPLKEYVFAVGDFSNWQPDARFYMNRTPDGNRYWITIDSLQAGREIGFYYLVDGTLRVADPLSTKILEPDDVFITPGVYPGLRPYPSEAAGATVTSVTPGRAMYQFRHPRPALQDLKRLTVYELLIRDFLGRFVDKSYRGITDTLNYLQRLGVNCIGLMPVSEFEGNNSWGYNPAFHNAIEKAYGPEDLLKAFIDSAHGRGMTVVLDVVYNHAFSRSPLAQMWWDGVNNRPAANSPYFNPIPRHDFNVGSDFNHESVLTQTYMDLCNKRLLEELNVDGFRFDLSKGFTQRNTLGNTGAWSARDDSRIALLNRMGAVCRQSYADALLILEHFADNSEETVLSNNGFLFWGNLNHAYGQVAMGFVSGSDFGGGYYRNRGWTNPHLLTFNESHDEERNMYRTLNFGLNNTSTGYNVRDTTIAIDRQKLVAALLFPIPGPKMIWQFGEMGYDLPINRCPNGTINNDCRTDPKPPRWNYLNDSRRLSLWKVYQALLRLRATHPALAVDNATIVANGNIKVITLRHPEGDLHVLGNMSTGAITSNPRFPATGRWYDFFSGDSIQVTDLMATRLMAPGEYHIYSNRRFAFTPERGIALPIARPIARTAGGTLRAYPNPARGGMSLIVDPVSDGRPLRQLTLTSIEGRVVATWAQDPAPGARTLPLPAALPSGMYLLEGLTTDGARMRTTIALE